jgi:hypothetical protein
MYFVVLIFRQFVKHFLMVDVKKFFCDNLYNSVL